MSLFEAQGEQLLAEGGIDWSTTPSRLVVRCTGQQEVCEELMLQQHADAIGPILDTLRALSDIQAVGHRVVHYTTAVCITPEVKRVIAALAELAPHHSGRCIPIFRNPSSKENPHGKRAY